MMKYDIEVVGERCRSRDEPRPSRAAHASTGQHGDASGQKRKGKHFWIASTTGRASPSSWRHTPYYGPGGAGGGRGVEDKEPISGEQTGRRVRITFVDNRGRVQRTPRPAKRGKGLLTPRLVDKASEAEEDDPGSPEGTQGLSGWGSSFSITSLSGGGRPYKPKSFVTSRDKILSSVLDKYFVDSPGRRSECSEADVEELDLNIFPAMPVPLPSGPPHLTPSFSSPLSPSPSTTLIPPPPPHHPNTSSPDTGHFAEHLFPTDSVSSEVNTPRSTLTNPTPNPPLLTSPSKQTFHGASLNARRPAPIPTLNKTRPGPPTTTTATTTTTSTTTTENAQPPGKGSSTNKPGGPHHKILNGIHAKGQGPTSSHVMNGIFKDGSGGQGDTSGSRFGSPLLKRAVADVTGSRIHVSVAMLMKEHLRNMYLYRHAQAGARGGWKGTGTYVARAYGRLRGRKKTVTKETVGEEGDENAPPPVSRMFRKFRMVGLLTVNLIRLKAAIVVNSTDRTERSAAEIQWRTLYGQQEAENLAFSKSYYSRERIITKMPNWALEIFDTLPEYRTEADCRKLHALFRGMRGFDKFTEEIQLNLCRAFTYACIEETRIILRRGHIGHNFYFIYSGSVFVNVPDLDSEGEIFIKTEAILAHGDSFGELALLKDIRRTATVSVRETCELLVVDKDIFSQVCPKIFEKELMEKKKFMSRMSLFSPKWWTADALSSLCLEAQIQEYKINKIVVENNTTEEWMYICMEGKCEVVRCMSGNEVEEEEEEEANGSKERKESSVILSDEILDLLTSAKSAGGSKPGSAEADNSKQKLLSSLGLEYAETFKRASPFLEEVEEEERRKAMLASSAPVTLTSLMAQQEEEGKTGLVYIKVGTLEADDVFDMYSLIKAPAPRTHSALLLVSCGARLLRVKKSLFLKLASPQAMEYTRTLVSKHPFPTEGAIVESYKRKVIWNAYKAKVVQDVVRNRDLRHNPTYRDERRRREEAAARISPMPPTDRSRTPKKLSPMLHSPRAVKRATTQDSDSFLDSKTPGGGGGDGGGGFPSSKDNSDLSLDQIRLSQERTDPELALLCARNSPRITVSEDSEEDRNESGLEAEGRKREEEDARLSSSVEVSPLSGPDTPRPDSAVSSEDLSPRPLPVPKALQKEVGPGPETIIIRRRSSLGFSSRPTVSVDTTFAARGRQSRDTPTSGHVTRFTLPGDSRTATVVVKNA